MRQPIKSREEVDAYLAGDLIQCLECDRQFATLAHHLRRAHGLSSTDYRAAWGLPAGTPLAGLAYRESRSAIAQRLVAAGVIGQHAATATEVAREAGRGARVDWERAEQAARAAATPRTELPPGSKRADGRDADHAREYQRGYRRSKRDV